MPLTFVHMRSDASAGARDAFRTPLWMAPEVITGSHDGMRYGPAADVWSLGMVLWETCTMELPWEQHHNKKFILNELLKAIEAGDRPEVGGGCWMVF